ncbi:unnamed protein product [Urochloa decumbens]|uniref:Protein DETOXIFICATION n=1 Tax=Urochloa decumbens TaxID=240449 RepID=A0ABC9EKT4_9POAL
MAPLPQHFRSSPHCPHVIAATETHGGIGGGEEGDKSSVLSEAKKQLRLAGPLIAGCLLQYAVQTVSVMFVGHLGKAELAGAAVATSFAGVTGFSLLTGMASSLDTLCGQAFGAGQHRLLGVYKQRAMLVLALASVPVAAAWACAGDILALCGMDAEVADGAGRYIRWMIPSLFAFGPLQCHARFLQAQKLVVPVMLSSGAAALCHPAVCWLLVRRLGLGSRGAALAEGVSYLANFAFLALYVWLSPSCKNTRAEFSVEAFRGIPGFMKLAVPSALMLCVGWWAFEVMMLLSGLLPNPKLEAAVLSICFNTNALAFMVATGLSAAISTRVSNELGAGRPQAARLATRVVRFLALCIGVSEALVVVLVRNIWGRAYSRDKDVVKYTAKMMPFVAASIMLDCQQAVLQGVIRGCGEQKKGVFINLAAYYLVGMPAAVILAFICHLRGIMGLWFGLLCGLAVQFFLLLVITMRINWDKEALKANDRVSVSTLPIDMASTDSIS